MLFLHTLWGDVGYNYFYLFLYTFWHFLSSYRPPRQENKTKTDHSRQVIYT